MKNDAVKTKKWHLALLAFIVIFSLGYKAYSTYWPRYDVRLGGAEFRVLVADTQSHRISGWSGRHDMGEYGGMLFVFAESGPHAMVMRDMLFPLDIVWFNGLTIVDMAPNLPPDAAKTEKELTPYFARLPSSLVLELPAGFIRAHGLKIGDRIDVLP